ncbi:PQQ-binding-like beta-propeller repeat protein [Bacillus sp. sid0103]|uniref:outer membrane protein assembly factor BamB family protein n=1 Tax=Bacillus sp. sid0103 TaxID=2856337 RepID=UPI001C44B860|nr:PQQ-binding-like beta-propeller repeat protein [Bacillus sp. sid0103]MBV7506198.1 PQQ-binding-like beta-propeller repeat protein [Bacillus sp. sid0103]
MTKNWEMHLADQGNTKYSSATMPVDLKLLTLKKDPFNNASALFSVNKNQLYSAERISKKILSATDLDTYKERWNFSTENQDEFLDLIARDGVIYASTMNNIYAIKDNGNAPQTLWTLAAFANRLLIDQNTLFYLTRTSEGLYAIGTVDANTGQKKWNYSLKFQEQIEGVFAAGGNKLFANIRNPVQMTSKMYAFDTSSGTVLWKFDLDSSLPIYGAPVYKEEKLYFETKKTTRTIWALDAASGRTLWKYIPTGYYTQPLSVTNDSLIVLDEANIMAIDKNTGVQKWKTMYAEQFVSGGLQTITGSDGMVIASDKIILENYNKLKFFNTANGQLIYSTLQLSTTTGGVGVRPIGVIKDTIFVTESNQILYTYAVPKPSQLDTEKPTATIDLPAVNQLTLQDGMKQIKIPITLSETSDMEVSIVDESGYVVRIIGNGRYLKGTANLYWDGKNSRGFNVIRGNYYVIVKLTDLAGNKNEYTARDKVIQITEGFGLTVKNANLRSAATTQSTILRTIPAGSEVVITGETGDWYQIEYRIVSAVLKGYVSKPLIKVPSNQEIQAIENAKTRTNVNVRTYPGTQYDTKIVLPMNTDIKIYSAIEYKKDSTTSDSGYVAKFTIALPTVSTFIYTVIAGDSLWKIAQKNGVTIDSIVKANNLDPNQPIYIGQKLIIVK